MVVHASLSQRLSTTVSLETRTDRFLSGCPLLKLYRRLVVEGGKDVGRTRAIRVGWQSRIWGQVQPNESRVLRCSPMSPTLSSSCRDRNKYDGIWFMLQTKEECSSINRNAIAERASLEEVDRPSPYIFRHIYFRHEMTTMTSETSENAIFVRFFFA